MKTKWAFSAAGVLAASLLATSASWTTVGAATSSLGNTAVYGATSQVMIFWDPSDSFSNEIIAMNNMYETLLRYNPITNTFTPVLATSYSKSKDSLTWTFQLRHNVHFHDGKLMTSADVKNSIERTIKRGQGAAYIWGAVKSIETPDAYTVKFDLKYPAPVDLIASSPYAAFVFNTDDLKKHGEKWFASGHEDGTGPYTLKSWGSNKPLVLTEYPGYWGGWKGSHYQNIVFETIGDANTKAQMLQSGQLTYSDMLPVQQLNALKNNSNVKIVQSHSFQNLIAFFNMKKKPLNNILVREALSDAFPYSQVITDIMHGEARQSVGPIPAGLWGHDGGLPVYHYNPSAAKSLLKKAGIQSGSLNLSLTYTAGDQNEQQIAELYKADLAQIGVNLSVKAMPWDAQWNLAKATDPNKRQDIFMMYWWPDYSNPYSFLFNLFHTESSVNFNVSYYYNKQYDNLIDKGNQAAGVNRSQAQQLFDQAQLKLVKDAPAIWVMDEDYVRAISSSMHGFVDNSSYPNVVFWYNVHP